MSDSLGWLLPRFIMAAVAVALGAFVGQWAGGYLRVPLLAELLGAACAVGVIVLIDAVRGHRLLQWLRGSQEGGAPRDTGLWGELGYRIERAVRERDKTIARERLELQQFLSAIEASPNGVLMLDDADHIHWCNRVAADHFSLDPERDLRQRITNLVRSPAFVAYLQAGQFKEPLQPVAVAGAAPVRVTGPPV